MSGFYVENFGCRAARADGEAVTSRLLSEGLTEQSLPDADIVVINTCSVTAEADRDARAFVRKTQRINPTARIVVTGCYAQRAPEEIAAFPGVSAVVGNSHKAWLPEIVLKFAGSGSPQSNLLPAAALASPADTAIWADDQFAHSSLESAQVLPGLQTRPNLKIQEGCGNRCTFCVIPTTRGGSRSLAAEKVMSQVRGFVEGGGRELVLSGINLGRWGRDLAPAGGEPTNLAEIVRRLLSETELPRLRLSSIEPMDWTPDLIALFQEFSSTGRIARHAHLPLQSGSDAVLRRMHRRYRPWHYADKLAALREAAGPQLGLGADVMVGFPGETDVEFRETFDFIASQPFTYLHLFPFSARPGTPGWELHHHSPVSSSAVHARMAGLRELIAAKTQKFRSALIGETLSAITLQTPEQISLQGHSSALTDNYIPVEIDESLLANQIVSVVVTDVDCNSGVHARLPASTPADSAYPAHALPVVHPVNSSRMPVAAVPSLQ